MRRVPLVAIVYLVVGIVVAYAEDYLENLETTKRVLSGVLGILLWPLVLVGFDVRVT